MNTAELLDRYKHLFKKDQGVVLDLACGQGANGLALKAQQIEVLFADINQQHLSDLASDHHVDNNALWHADFEGDGSTAPEKLSTLQLQGCIVFRYLHRPLFDAIKKAIKPGGFVIYETFTINNKQFGRPNSERFLLQENELKALFSDWTIHFYFEGIKHDPIRSIAQIVCQKPLTES